MRESICQFFWEIICEIVCVYSEPDAELRGRVLHFWDSALPSDLPGRLQALLASGLDCPGPYVSTRMLLTNLRRKYQPAQLTGKMIELFYEMVAPMCAIKSPFKISRSKNQELLPSPWFGKVYRDALTECSSMPVLS